jgi:hypothetical protein
MRRRFSLGVTALVVLAFGILLTLWFATRPAHRINEHNIQQLKQGMTRAEVEAIFGVPPGDYSTRPVEIRFDLDPPCETWPSNNARVQIHFDDNGRYDGQAAYMVFQEDWWTKLRRWVQLK